MKAGGTSNVTEGNRDYGNNEFSPFNYGGTPRLDLGGRGTDACDFNDDLYSDSGAGYGCIQVHNYLDGQTVFAFNNYNYDNNGAPDVTIGNGTGDHPDGTFLHNAGSFEVVNLRVFVRPRARGLIILVQ